MKVNILILYKKQKEAKVISDAVSPDNIIIYEKLSIKTHQVNNQVSTLIEYKGKNIVSFQSTINDLLSCVSVAERAYKATINF